MKCRSQPCAAQGREEAPSAKGLTVGIARPVWGTKRMPLGLEYSGQEYKTYETRIKRSAGVTQGEHSFTHIHQYLTFCLISFIIRFCSLCLSNAH